MKPAQELVDEWFDRPCPNITYSVAGWRRVEWKVKDGPVELMELVRDARVELLEELIEETQYGNVGSADYLRSRLKEARTK